MISTVLFDLDGTILDTNKLMVKSMQFALKKHLDLNISDEEIHGFFGEPLTTTISRYTKNGVQTILDTFRNYDLEHHELLTHFFPGTKELIRQLHFQGINIGIVTSKHRFMASKCNHLAELDQYINTIVTFDDVTKVKPDPEPIMKALTQLEVQPSTTIMVGDSPADIQSAKRAGTYSAAVKWSVFPMNMLLQEQPDYILNMPSDLISVINP